MSCRISFVLPVVLDIFALMKSVFSRAACTLLLIFICASIHLDAEPLVHQLNRGQSYLTFRNITLPFDDNQVNVIFQDDKGVIWLGTKRGLYSFNGYDLHQYTDVISSNQARVLSIVQVDDTHLCLGTDRGIKWFDLLHECFCSLYPDMQMSQGVGSLALYENKLWIGTQDLGLMRMDFVRGEIESVASEKCRETTIYDIEPVEDKIFIASHEHLSYYDLNTGERHLIDLGYSDKLLVNSLLWDKKRNCVWVGTRGSLYKYDLGKKDIVWKSALEGISLKTLSQDTDGNLLIGTDAGLYVLDIDSRTYTNVVHDSRNSKSLCNDIVLDILHDKNHNIWLGTDSGISLVQSSQWQREIHLSELVQSGEGNLFSYMLKDSYGDYWFGGKNGLIHIGNDTVGKADWFRQDSDNHHLNHNRVRYIFEDSGSDIWIASDGGVGKYNRRKGSFTYYDINDKETLQNANWAYSIEEDSYGRMWIASYKGGLFVCDKKTMDVLYHFDESSGVGNNVYRLQNDRNGHIWACTSLGLVSINTNTMEVKPSGVESFNMIYFKDSIWYSVLGKLYRYNIETSEITDVPYSETCSQIYSFIPGDDRLWFISADGVFSVDPATLSVRNLTFTAAYYLCGLYDKNNNELLLGGEDCIVSLSIDKKPVQSHREPVFISSLSSNGELMKFEDHYSGSNPKYGHNIELRSRSSVVVELSSYSYMSDEAYFYKFDNDRKWSALRKGQNHIPLVNLSGGTYTLMLSGSNPDLDPSSVISEYTITVPYPWFLDRRAFIIYSVLLSCLVIIIIRQVRVRNRKKFEAMDREMKHELTNMKMDFFVNMSHELKTPLSLIIAPVSQMLSETSNAKQRKTLSKIHDNALRLNTLIHKILDFRQLEVEGEDSLMHSHVEVCSMLRECINIFSAIIEEKKITVNLNTQAETVWADIDKWKIESSIINIISNAIKYVEKDTGVIDVNLDVKDTNLQITIADNGCGIDKEELHLVFVRYFQGRHSKGREGTGIGLYLVKKYVELHGGRISIESEEGTTVRMTIPIASSKDNGYDKRESLREGQRELSERILIVDDNTEIVAFLNETLSEHYECRCAYNGKEGLMAMNDFVPDLIIVDEMMPEMDGLSFCRNVRKNQPTAAIPIIMLTAKDDTGTELQSIKAGVDVFMAKPFDIKKLQLRIVQLLSRKDSIEKSVRIDVVSQKALNETKDYKSYDEKFIENVIRIIEDNMDRDDFDVARLAQLLAVDSKQLYRKVKQLTGYSPVNYIRKLRMNKASLLLMEGKFTVAEVMYMVGYSNSSYFSKCFTEEFGLKPKDYALKNRNPLK